MFLKYLLVFLSILVVSSEESKKYVNLRALALKSSNYVINMDLSTYRNYVPSYPRDYDVVIFFTATMCGEFCELLYKEFEKTALLYYENGEMNYSVRELGRNPVFFAKMVFSQATQEIFVKLEFKSVPNIVIFKAALGEMRSEVKLRYLRDFKWRISPYDGHVTAEKILEFLNKRLGTSVEFKEDFDKILKIFAGIVAAGAVLWLLLAILPRLMLSPKLWFVGSLIVYTVCMSGLIYNIIHDIPLVVKDKNGETQWMSSRGGRDQLGAEGIIMAVSISFSGIVLLLISKVNKIFRYRVLQWIIFAVLVYLVFRLITFVEITYKKKSGFYTPNYWPPSHYIKGPLRNDQGNSF